MHDCNTGNWIEHDPQGGGAHSGQVLIKTDDLTFTKASGTPSAYRQVNLKGTSLLAGG
jgi:hypothetical protein